MLKFLERVVRRKAEIAIAVRSEWQQLVLDVAAERERDADEVLASLSRLGKSPEDLQSAVDLYQRRRELARTVADGTSGESRLAVIQAESERLRSERAKFEELMAEKERPLRSERERVVSALSAAQSARRELIDGATDEGLRAAMQSADSRVQELGALTEECSRRREENATLLRNLEQTRADRGDDADPSEDEIRLEGARDELNTEAESLREQAEVAAAAAAAARNALLAPEAI